MTIDWPISHATANGPTASRSRRKVLLNRPVHVRPGVRRRRDRGPGSLPHVTEADVIAADQAHAPDPRRVPREDHAHRDRDHAMPPHIAGFVSVPGFELATPALRACTYCAYSSAAASPPPKTGITGDRPARDSISAPSPTNRNPCASPRCTHFMRVSARVLALISVVCGLEFVAEMMSYMSVANTAMVIAPLPLPRASANVHLRMTRPEIRPASSAPATMPTAISPTVTHDHRPPMSADPRTLDHRRRGLAAA